MDSDTDEVGDILMSMPTTPNTFLRRGATLGAALSVLVAAAAPMAHADGGAAGQSLSGQHITRHGAIASASVSGSPIKRGQAIPKNWELVRYDVKTSQTELNPADQKVITLTAPKGYEIRGLGTSSHPIVGFATHDHYGQRAMRVAFYVLQKDVVSARDRTYLAVRKSS